MIRAGEIRGGLVLWAPMGRSEIPSMSAATTHTWMLYTTAESLQVNGWGHLGWIRVAGWLPPHRQACGIAYRSHVSGSSGCDFGPIVTNKQNAQFYSSDNWVHFVPASNEDSPGGTLKEFHPLATGSGTVKWPTLHDSGITGSTDCGSEAGQLCQTPGDLKVQDRVQNPLRRPSYKWEDRRRVVPHIGI